MGTFVVLTKPKVIDSSWNVMAHGDAREGKCRGNWRLEWVASTLHTTSERGVSSFTTADAHTSAASIRLNWPPRRFKRTLPFRPKRNSGFCACAITFQKQSNLNANMFVRFTYKVSWYCLLLSSSARCISWAIPRVKEHLCYTLLHVLLISPWQGRAKY